MMDKVVTNADRPSLSYKLNKLALALIFQWTTGFFIQRDMREMDRTLGTWTDLMTFNSTIIIS